MTANDAQYTLEEAAAVLDLPVSLVVSRLKAGNLQSLRRTDVDALKPVLEEQHRLMVQINDDFDGYHKAVNESLRIKWMPFGPGFRIRDLERYQAFLDSDASEQTEFLKTVPDEEVEFWIELLTARAMYKDPVDRNPGSITEDKVRAYPDRYAWEPKQ